MYAMVAVRNLAVAFSGHYLFENVSFSIGDNEKIGLIGRNGSGKSTFLKILMGIMEADEGEIAIPKHHDIGFLQQHIAFTHDSVVAEVASVLPSDRVYESWKGEKILTGLGFSEDDMLTDPGLFSGGYQVKIQLAKLLLQEPSLLLLDEPTNYLDIHSSAWLKRFLKKWPSAMILITHDRLFMDDIITHTLYIHRGSIRKTRGKTANIYTQVATEEAIHEQTRMRQEKQQKATQAWIDKVKAKASMATRAQSRAKQLAKQTVLGKLSDQDQLAFHFPFCGFQSREFQLQTQQLRFGYCVDKILINQFSFALSYGDKVCVIGKNGKGKSTLLRLLAHELQPLAGAITQHDKTALGYFAQTNIARLDSTLTVFDQLAQFGPQHNEQTLRSVAANLMFDKHRIDKRISMLSGGEKSRVMLGRLLLNPSNLLLLDEPTNHFDMESCEALITAIKDFPGSVVMVSHDERYLQDVATKLIVLDQDKIFFYNGSYARFLKDVGWQAI